MFDINLSKNQNITIPRQSIVEKYLQVTHKLKKKCYGATCLAPEESGLVSPYKR
jgi:hypothetical protein